MSFDIFFWRKKRKPNGQLPVGQIEVTRAADDRIILSFLGRDGHFHWFAFSDDATARRLAQKLDAVAARAVDHA